MGKTGQKTSGQEQAPPYYVSKQTMQKDLEEGLKLVAADIVRKGVKFDWRSACAVYAYVSEDNRLYFKFDENPVSANFGNQTQSATYYELTNDGGKYGARIVNRIEYSTSAYDNGAGEYEKNIGISHDGRMDLYLSDDHAKIKGVVDVHRSLEITQYLDIGSILVFVGSKFKGKQVEIFLAVPKVE